MSRSDPRPRRVVLVRHAPAMRRDPGRWPTDEDRPLRPEGRREFRRAAEGLADLLTPRGRAATSPFARASETAAILAARWRPARGADRWDELRPDGPPEALLDRMRSAAAVDSDLVVIGHEPQLSRWVGFALTGEALSAVRFSKGGAVAIEFAGNPKAGGGRLRWVLTRRQLARLGAGRRPLVDPDD